jgi:hypothetical protein
MVKLAQPVHSSPGTVMALALAWQQGAKPVQYGLCRQYTQQASSCYLAGWLSRFVKSSIVGRAHRAGKDAF